MDAEEGNHLAFRILQGTDVALHAEEDQDKDQRDPGAVVPCNLHGAVDELPFVVEGEDEYVVAWALGL